MFAMILIASGAILAATSVGALLTPCKHEGTRPGCGGLPPAGRWPL